MIVLEYIYYKYYQFWNLFSFGMSKMHYRAAFFVTMFTAANIATILKLFDIKLVNANKLLIIGLLVVWLALNIKYFVKPKRHRKIITKFRNESILYNAIGSTVVLTYSVLSFIFFIKIMSS